MCSGKKVLQGECAVRTDQTFGAEVEGAWWWECKKLGASQARSHMNIGSPRDVPGAWFREPKAGLIVPRYLWEGVREAWDSTLSIAPAHS